MFCILYLLIFKDSNNAIVSPGNPLHLFSFQTPIFINYCFFYKNYLKMYYYIVLVKWNTKTK